MIHEADLNEAIAECIGKRNPDAQTCIKLAAFFIIKENMFPETREQIDQKVFIPDHSYSFSNKEPETDIVEYESESEFGSAVHGLQNPLVWPLIDELVETIGVINPKLYEAFMHKIKAL